MKFTTDKVQLGYLPTYLRLAAELGTQARVCEIGVHEGRSLEMWTALFPDGVIVGVDLDPTAVWPEGTHRVIGNQYDEDLAARLSQICERFDLIVEDGAHEGGATLACFNQLWPMVRPGGYYVVEDWQIGLPGWPGGNGNATMLDAARQLLVYMTPGVGVESMLYRHGQIVIRRRMN